MFYFVPFAHFWIGAFVGKIFYGLTISSRKIVVVVVVVFVLKISKISESITYHVSKYFLLQGLRTLLS